MGKKSVNDILLGLTESLKKDGERKKVKLNFHLRGDLGVDFNAN